MKTIGTILLFTLIAFQMYADVHICSWNIENFGNTKSDAEIETIATLLRDYDIIAIQEVVAGNGGPQAVAKLHDALHRKGSSWDYVISDPTSSSAYKTERYAFIWKTSKVSRVGDPWLEKKYHLKIDREPYFMTFQAEEKYFTLVNFHAITKSMQPETEVKYLKYLPIEYPDKNLIFCGDFNLPEDHTVFLPLKSLGYKPIFTNQKTSLRQECLNNDCLASEFDNIFYNSSKVKFIKSGVVLFYEKFASFEQAREISDHIPIYFLFILN
jgi:endonuclease/exonuclease/phosphatase family metal-dependent hydrolase